MVQDDDSVEAVPTFDVLLKEQGDVVRLAASLRTMLLEADFGEMFAQEMGRRYVIKLLGLDVE